MVIITSTSIMIVMMVIIYELRRKQADSRLTKPKPTFTIGHYDYKDS